MERIHSPIIIRNLKTKTMKLMSLNLDKIFKKIIIRQRPNLFPCNSTKNFKRSNLIQLTPRKNKSKDTIKKDITNLLKNNIVTNTELKKKLISIKNEISKNDGSKTSLNQIKKRFFSSKTPVKLSKIEFNKNSSQFLKDRFFPVKAEKVVKDLRKIFSYNILPGKDEHKFKFIKPKSYIEKNYFNSERKDNNYDNNESIYFSRSLLFPTCSKSHGINNLVRLNKLKNELFIRNYEENNIYKTIVKKRLLRSKSSFRIGNRFTKNFAFAKINKEFMS